MERITKCYNLNLRSVLYDKNDTETIGQLIKKERLLRGWTQQKLADLFQTGNKYFYDEYFDFQDKNFSEILKCWRIKNSLTEEKAAVVFGVTKET